VLAGYNAWATEGCVTLGKQDIETSRAFCDRHGGRDEDSDIGEYWRMVFGSMGM
jgi:hypothetical protein